MSTVPQHAERSESAIGVRMVEPTPECRGTAAERRVDIRVWMDPSILKAWALGQRVIIFDPPAVREIANDSGDGLLLRVMT